MAGETVSVAASSARLFRDLPSGTFFIPYSLTFSSTNNEASDVMEAGYFPPNCRPLMVLWAPTDMDTNVSPAAVHKVTIGSTDIVTGLTGAQTGAASLTVCTQAAVTATPSTSAELVKVTTTTAAATGAAGTALLLILAMHL
jgi:hypothetical protein